MFTLKNTVRFGSIVLLLTTYINLVYVFLNAYSVQSKTTLVTINVYGEAFSELILLTIVIPIFLISWAIVEYRK